jgi:hypothetical protein
MSIADRAGIFIPHVSDPLVTRLGDSRAIRSDDTPITRSRDAIVGRRRYDQHHWIASANDWRKAQDTRMTHKTRSRRLVKAGRQYPRGRWLIAGVVVIAVMIALAVGMFLTLSPAMRG